LTNKKIGYPKTLDLDGQNMISILIIVLSRNGISIEITTQELMQNDQHTENS